MRTTNYNLIRIFSLLLAACTAHVVSAGVLPEDRADVMYHSYDGGNVKVTGPALLVRKKIGEQISVSAAYDSDMVSSASIDYQVINQLSQASPSYTDKRTQKNIGVDYLRGKTTYNLSFINSDESDYIANTASIGVSEDMFGDLTTISLGYTRAWDEVFKNQKTNGVKSHDPTYGKKPVDHRSYRVGFSQILTKHLIMGVNYESQTHEGELNNPYRKIRYLGNAGTAIFTDEIYPGTRTTNALAIDGRYYLPYRASVKASYRYFRDTWGIIAHTAEIGYTHPWHSAWTFEGSYRYHTQHAADFYSDLFPRANSQNFMARDRNLATMNDQSIHLGVSYDVAQMEAWTRSWLKKGSVNLFVDHLIFNFADFRDARYNIPGFSSTTLAAGTEPLYSESANMIRFFLSVWF